MNKLTKKELKELQALEAAIEEKGGLEAFCRICEALLMIKQADEKQFEAVCQNARANTEEILDYLEIWETIKECRQ